MADEPGKWQPLREALREVDWPRALHRGLVLLRTLRGDDVGSDTSAEVERARLLRSTMTAVARHAVGCRIASGSCDCPVCKEEREA